MDKNLHRLLLPLGITAGATLLLLLVRGVVFRFWGKWTKRHDTPIHTAVLEIFRGPSLAWCLAMGLYIGVEMTDTPVRQIKQFYQTINVIMIFSATMAIANVSAALFRNVMIHADNATRTSGLALGIVKGSILVIGGVLALSVLGISVAPLLTALGVGGLAVALALKDTLENLFAGIYLITDRAIRVGDMVKLEFGQEGRVADIGWRTTRIATTNHNIVILPNSKLAQSVVTNFSLPDERVSTSLRIQVGLEADPERVEAIALEEAKKGTEDIAGLLLTPDATFRFSPGFIDGVLEMNLYFYVNHFSDQAFVQHALRKRIFKRLRAENIPLAKPFWLPRPA